MKIDEITALKSIKHYFLKLLDEIIPDSQDSSNACNILYRGQEHAGWGLKTTLERVSINKTNSITEYYSQISDFTFEIKNHFNAIFNREEIYEAGNVIDPSVTGLPKPEYLAHLRHIGYPSPLLDWSESPFVALFFACSNESVDGKVFRISEPHMVNESKRLKRHLDVNEVTNGGIRRVGPMIDTHPRHLTQQATYLVAIKDSQFVPFEDVLSGYKKSWGYTEIIIPKEQKRCLRKMLKLANITNFSLFGDADSFAKDKAFEVFGKL